MADLLTRVLFMTVWQEHGLHTGGLVKRLTTNCARGWRAATDCANAATRKSRVIVRVIFLFDRSEPPFTFPALV